MLIPVFLKGLLIGFSIAAPVGPIGLLRIRRTLAEGRANGFVSGLGAGLAGNYGEAASPVGGVFVGSALWWLGLSLGAGLLRSRFDRTLMTWVNRLSGAIIVAFGVVALLSLLGPIFTPKAWCWRN